MKIYMLNLIIFCSVFLNSCYDSEDFLRRKENSIKGFTQIITQVDRQTGKGKDVSNLVYPRNKAGLDILNNISNKDELKQPIITYISFYHVTDIKSKVIVISWLAISSCVDGILIRQRGKQDIVLNFNEYCINENKLLSKITLDYTSFIEYDANTMDEIASDVEIALIQGKNIISKFHKIDIISTDKSVSGREDVK